MEQQEFNTIIDTMEIRTGINNLNITDMEDIEDDNRVIKKPRLNAESNVLIPLSFNRAKGRYARVESLKELKEDMEEFLVQVLGVEILEDIKLNRIDIAIDSDLDFKSNFKYLLYMYSLILHSDKYANSWTTINHKDYKANTLHSKSTQMDIVFYDKNNESEGKAPYLTRMEFRAKNLSTMDFEKHIDRIIDRIKEMDINIPMLNRVTIDKICKLYDDDFGSADIFSFNEFVRKYNHLIFNREILEGLYSHAGMKGNLTNWLKKFRKQKNKFGNQTKLELFTATDITNYQKECIKSLKKYKNS